MTASRRADVQAAVEALDTARTDLVDTATAELDDARDDVAMLTNLVALGKFSGRNGIRGHRLVPPAPSPPGLGLPAQREPLRTDWLSAAALERIYGRPSDA